uniref:Probable pectate lyase F n=1 Tax=Globisporangium ultimum (strain ATCC 200006 / CBS 805.95 / DAOM BR144) TaxID=431595 RepID=K3WR96_GLOUD
MKTPAILLACALLAEHAGMSSSGGVLKNVIIGASQVVGVFCSDNSCAVDNVWSEAVCQAAVVIDKGIGTTTVSGGGAKGAASRVILAKAAGTTTISGNFYMENCGELYESCATCGPVKRVVIVDGVVSVSPTRELVRVNKNYKDEANIANAKIVTSRSDYQVCTHYDGGKNPAQAGAGASGSLCHYSSTTATVIVQ